VVVTDGVRSFLNSLRKVVAQLSGKPATAVLISDAVQVRHDLAPISRSSHSLDIGKSSGGCVVGFGVVEIL
jgi:hypothetical protein